MARQATRAELARQLAAHPDTERSLFAATRILRKVNPAALLDASDWQTETPFAYDEPEGDRYVAYGYRTPHSADFLILEIGSGAGESVLHVEAKTVEQLEQWANSDGAPYGIRIIYERACAFILNV